MAEQIFKFPGFFDREIDLTAQTSSPVGIPAGVVGASEKGQAFIPYTVGSFSDFITKFGDLNPSLAAPYAVEKFLQNRNALTFVRVLGAGANTTTADFEATRTDGTVKNAGFKVVGTTVGGGDGRQKGAVQFIVAKHVVSASEAIGYPIFTDNDSYPEMSTGNADDTVYLIRGEVFCASTARIMLLDHNESWTAGADDVATPSGSLNPNYSAAKFKLVISSSLGTSFGNSDGFAGLRIYTASLDPSDDSYIGKLLNTDPEKFEEEQHYLYADYAVDAEVAYLSGSTASVAVLSGSSSTSSRGKTFLETFGRFDTRYTTPSTPWFISQPFGGVEYDLFRIESRDDGAFANSKYKVSITNLVASSNPNNLYGTFTVVVREFDDSDVLPKVVEQFINVNLDPNSDTYIAKVIGDRSAYYNFDALEPSDRRIITQGTYLNRSNYIRVVMNPELERGNIPVNAMPFGFRGLNTLNSNSTLTDVTGSTLRLAGSGSSTQPRLLGAIVPPLPFRFKVTRGEVNSSGAYVGEPGNLEIADSRYYWGVKFERTTNVLNSNIEVLQNNLVSTLTKFAGIPKLDATVTGSYTDQFNSNKFTLARVALYNTSISDVTASSNVHMREASYIRDGVPDVTNYTIVDPVSSDERVTLASLLQKAPASTFNIFSQYAKFTAVMAGGFDGVNILDKNAATLNDRATSTESRGSVLGNCNGAFVSPGLSSNVNGLGIQNNTVASYRTALDIITNPLVSNANLLAVPGQRDLLVTDYARSANQSYGLSMYLMDVPNYNDQQQRIWDGDTVNSGTIISVENTAAIFESRNIDDSLVAAYFPDVVINDARNNRRVTVPATVAAIAALGYNDKVAYPWFAPAGFNRAALDFVSLTKTRLNQSDRERLYQVRINPIVKFPRENYVIFAQKTLDNNQTSLDSINVQRMVLDVKKQVIDVGNRLIFEQLTPALRQQFVKNVTPILTNVQSRGGLQQFKIICDNTNNTNLDVENNRMNAKILLVPVKAVEFIAIDFIITRAGVEFV